MDYFLLIIVLIFVILIYKDLRNDNKYYIKNNNNLSENIEELKNEVKQLKEILLSKNIDELKNNIDELKELLLSKGIDKEQKIEEDISELNEYVEKIENLKTEELDKKSEETEPIISEEIPSEEELEHYALNLYTDETNVEKNKTTESLSTSNYSATNSVKEHDQSVEDIFKSYTSQKSWLQKFKEKNPDLEKFIGENLINKIGILILVLGISYFVKYAIDRDWISEPLRVGIGILAGSILMGIAHKLRKSYAAFSSVMVGGAISVFYFTIGIAFHDYQLFSQTTAFIIMVIITIFSAFVSVSYNRQELAIFSLIGGFAVPFMVSTGEGNYNVLFTYIAILNIGMLIISYFKKWPIVNLLAFIFTSILYASWLGIKIFSEGFPYLGAFIYASLYYIIFSIMVVINNIRNKGNFSKMGYTIMLLNTLFYFTVGTIIIENFRPELKGIFTIFLALYNLVFAYILYKKFGINRNAIYLLLGISLTFVTLTIPFQFNGNYITLFWACEAVLLIWLSQKSKIFLFKLGGIIVQGLMILSLLMDWNNVFSPYNEDTLAIFFNKMFLTGIFATVSLVISYYLLKKEQEISVFYILKFDPKIYREILLILSIIIGYCVGLFEVSYQSNQYLSNVYSANSFSALYHFIFCSVFIYLLLKNANKIKFIIVGIICSLNIVLYLLVYKQFSINEFYQNFILGINIKSAMVIHYLLLLFTIYFVYVLFKFRYQILDIEEINKKYVYWILATFIVFVSSYELIIHGVFFSKNIIDIQSLNSIKNEYSDLLEFDKKIYLKEQFSVVKTQIIKIGFPILWGVLSFIFLIIGINKKIKQLRIIALALLGLTILKLFIYDINNVSETGKIIAFILLGIVILIISFVYQKIKKLVVDETVENKESTDDE